MFDPSAKSSMQGYFYQPFYALYILLNTDITESNSAKIYIENLDDIDFVFGNEHLTLFQNKHHIKRQASISDKSTDLWKTLRVWAERIKNNDVNVNSTRFVLTTTSRANQDSIADLLSLDKNTRNTELALQRLIQIAEEQAKLKTSDNDCYAAFYGLEPSLRKILVENIYILDEQPDISNIQSDIKNLLKNGIRRDHIDYFFEKLIGWWFTRVIEHIATQTQTPISYTELDEKLADIRDEFKTDNLPIDYEFDFKNVTADTLTLEQKNFITQLELILINDNGISQAILDYYRAYMQRSKWLKEGSIYLNDLDNYEERLIQEWERIKVKLETQIDMLSTNNKIRFGQKLYFEVGDLKLPICNSITHSNKGFYIMRGSYHILANALKIGWHPNYREKISTLSITENNKSITS